MEMIILVKGWLCPGFRLCQPGILLIFSW